MTIGIATVAYTIKEILILASQVGIKETEPPSHQNLSLRGPRNVHFCGVYAKYVYELFICNCESTIYRNINLQQHESKPSSSVSSIKQCFSDRAKRQVLCKLLSKS